MAPTDSHCVPPSRSRSCTIRTARSRNSGENCFAVFCVMAPSSHRLEPPGNPGRFKASLGPDHPEVAIYLNNLATLLKDTNRVGEAEPLMRRALAITEASLGPDHPDVATRLNNLARLLQDTNQLGEAEPLMRRGLVILLSFQRATGHAHPNRDAGLANYASLLRAMGKSEVETRAAIEALSRGAFGTRGTRQ